MARFLIVPNLALWDELEGVRTLIERYRKAGIRDISWNFYDGGRHEMLNEINRGEVQKESICVGLFPVAPVTWKHVSKENGLAKFG